MAMNYYPNLTKKDLKGIFKGVTEFLLLFSFRRKGRLAGDA